MIDIAKPTLDLLMSGFNACYYIVDTVASIINQN